MSYSNICRLCLNDCADFQSLYDDNGLRNELFAITCQYFHSAILNMEEYTDFKVLCNQCWQHICDFHNFQASVSVAQSKLVQVKPEKEEFHCQDVKEEYPGTELITIAVCSERQFSSDVDHIVVMPVHDVEIFDEVEHRLENDCKYTKNAETLLNVEDRIVSPPQKKNIKVINRRSGWVFQSAELGLPEVTKSKYPVKVTNSAGLVNHREISDKNDAEHYIFGIGTQGSNTT